jgi:hypothetical protein
MFLRQVPSTRNLYPLQKGMEAKACQMWLGWTPSKPSLPPESCAQSPLETANLRPYRLFPYPSLDEFISLLSTLSDIC